MTDNPTTPYDLCRDLGIEESVGPLVDLIYNNNSRALTVDVVRFAITIGVRGLLSYQSREISPEYISRLRRTRDAYQESVSFWANKYLLVKADCGALEAALLSIASSSCCSCCKEAALVARTALTYLNRGK